MKRASSILMGAVVLAACVLPATAKPLNVAQVPAGAKWLVHLDADAVIASEAWKIVSVELAKNAQAQEGIQNLELLTGFRFPRDLHSVTIYGTDFNEQKVVVVVNAVGDQNKILSLLPTNPSYASSKHGKHEIHSWEDNGKKLHGAFQAQDTFVLSQGKESVQAALDLLDGKGQALAVGSPLTQGATPGILAYVAGEGLAQLQQAESPLVGMIDRAWIALAEQDRDFVLKAQAQAKTAEMAQQMVTAMQGFKAVFIMMGSGEKADPGAKALAQILQNATIKTEGTAVSVEIRANVDFLHELAKQAAMKRFGGPAALPKN